MKGGRRHVAEASARALAQIAPPGWIAAQLGDVAELQPGYAFDSDWFATSGMKLLRGTNIVPGGTRWEDVAYLPLSRIEKFAPYALNAGDIVIAMDRPFISTGLKVARLTETDCPALLLQRVGRFHPSAAVSTEFLHYYLQGTTFSSHTGGLATGTQLPHISKTDIETCPVLVPPMNEQRRIVAKLDAIFEQTHATKARLERLPALLDKLERSILAAAFRGELTAEWRASHPAGEPASEVIDRIRADRRRRWEEAIRAKGKDPSKGKYDDHIEIDADDLPELPPNWSWASLGTLSWDSGYGTSEKCAYEGVGEYVLRIPNVASGDIDVSDMKRSLTGLGLKRDELIAAGDFLIVRTNGSRDLIGRAACALDTDPAIGHYFASYLIRFRLANPMVGRWLSLWWRSPFMRRWLELHAASSAGQYNVSLSTLATAPIPLANANEIGRIVDLVEQGLDAAHTLSARVERGAIRTSDLERAALAKAFRGELVEQDPDDEPAAALIERIRAVADKPKEKGAAKPRGRVARAKSQGRTALAETES